MSKPKWRCPITPAEEMGLSGLSLAGRVRQALLANGDQALLNLADQIREDTLRRHVIYLRDGQAEPIRLLPSPITVLPDQIAYILYPRRSSGSGTAGENASGTGPLICFMILFLVLATN